MANLISSEMQCAILCFFVITISAVIDVELEGIVNSIPENFISKVKKNLEGFYNSVKNIINQKNS